RTRGAVRRVAAGAARETGNPGAPCPPEMMPPGERRARLKLKRPAMPGVFQSIEARPLLLANGECPHISVRGGNVSHREAHATLAVDLEHLDAHVVAFLELVRHPLDALLADLRDVHQAVA